MSDLIDRQQAIEAITDELDKIDHVPQWVFNRIEKAINKLPSDSPEIIYCMDCKHFVREDIEEQTPYGFYNTYFHAFCDKHWDEEQGEYIDVKLDDFCSFAERRED